MLQHENLKGRVAVVTGGGGVLCSSFAKDLAASGVKVAVLDIRKEAAQAVADEINASGGAAIGIACDVLSAESLEAARQTVHAAFGPCDILFKRCGRQLPARHNNEGDARAGGFAAKGGGRENLFRSGPQGH